MANKIYRFLKQIIKLNFPIFRDRRAIDLMLGSAGIEQKGWLSVDYPIVDITNNKSLLKYFSENSVDRILAEHVWEHLTLEQGLTAAKNSLIILKPGGLLRIAVPDGYHVEKDYIDSVKPGGTGSGSDDHKILYNYKTLSQLLRDAGFDIRVLEYFDETGEFHSSPWDIEDGLIRRSRRFDPRNSNNRLLYTSLIIDAIKPEHAVY